MVLGSVCVQGRERGGDRGAELGRGVGAGEARARRVPPPGGPRVRQPRRLGGHHQAQLRAAVLGGRRGGGRGGAAPGLRQHHQHLQGQRGQRARVDRLPAPPQPGDTRTLSRLSPDPDPATGDHPGGGGGHHGAAPRLGRAAHRGHQAARAAG